MDVSQKKGNIMMVVPTILLVDDQRVLTDVLACMLSYIVKGAEVIPLNHPNEAALVLYSGTLPTVLITDWQMPGISGAGLIKAAIESGLPPERIICVSGGPWVDRQEMERAIFKETGHHVACFLKPILDFKDGDFAKAVQKIATA